MTVAAAGAILYAALLLLTSPVDYRLIDAPGGWAYEIRVKGRVVIYQDRIPAVGQNRPFPDKASARRVAREVAGRIERGCSPALGRDEVPLIMQGKKL